MDKLAELLAQQEELTKQIEEQKKAGRAEALESVKKLITSYSFSAGELRGVLKTKAKSSTKKDGAKRASYPAELKAKAVAMLKSGKKPGEVAKELSTDELKLVAVTVASWNKAPKTKA